MDLARYLVGLAFLTGSMAVAMVVAHLTYKRIFNRTEDTPAEPLQKQPAKVFPPPQRPPNRP